MKKPAELRLIKLVLEHEGKLPSELWEHLSKQDYHYLEKWSEKGYWDYGVSSRSGWLTDKGREEFEKMEAK